MSKKKIFISSIIVSIFLLFGIYGFAYFIKAIDNPHDISSTLTDKTVVEVKNATEFYKAVTYYDETMTNEYNSDSLVSSTIKRKTIKLTDNIKLYNDVLVTSDCHINLNSYSIDLNGYRLVFKHQFDGTFTVYSNPASRTNSETNVTTTGSIIDSSTGTTITNDDGTTSTVKGTILIDCPNACIDFSDTIVTDAAIVVENASATQVINSAMKLVYSNIQNGAVNDFYTTINTVEDYGKDICGTTFTHTTNSTSCIYTYTDLDLIYNYFAYEGLEITYSSGNTAILTNGGKVLSTTTTTTVSLTVTISYNKTTITKVVDVHVLATADYGKAANNIVLQYLSNFYDSSTRKYAVDRPIFLPKYNSYFGTTYNYSVISSLGTTTFDPINDTFNDYFDGTQTDDYVITTLTTEVTNLTVTTGTASSTVGVTGTASSAINDNYSYASKIAMNLYGNQIIIKDENTLNGYTMYDLLTNPALQGYGYSRLSEISYTVQCSEGTYTHKLDNKDSNGDGIADFDLLEVDEMATTKPYLGQDATLIVHFHFNTDGPDEDKLNDVVDIPIKIVYEISEPGVGFADFAPYYVYFNKQFKNETNYYTYNSFEIPLSLDGNYPSYGFIVYEEIVDVDGNVTYKRITDSEVDYDDNTRYLFKITNNANGYTSFEGTTLMNITIDPYLINEKDTKYHFLYVPVWKDAAGTIYYYYDDDNKGTIDSLASIAFDTTTIQSYKYDSILTVPGIVRFDCNESVITEAFADKEMYKIAYELINGYGSYADNKFIISSTLGDYIEKVDFSSGTNSLLNKYGYTMKLGTIANDDNIIGSLKGINLLTGIKELTFNGTNLGANANFVTNLGYVSQITNLSKLDLGNTGIYDQTAGTLGFPNGDDNGFLSSLTSLSNLKELNLANNKIYNFSALTGFVSLEKVDISNNQFTVSSGIDLLDPLFNTLINTLYGSNGAINAATFTTLQTSGVTVTGAGSSTVDSNTLAIINALTSLEYQDKVSKNIDLNTALTELNSKSFGDFGIPQNYKISGGEDVTITFTFNGIQFIPKSDGSGFTMVIKYHWVAKQWDLIPVATSGDTPIEYTYEYKVTRY